MLSSESISKIGSILYTPLAERNLRLLKLNNIQGDLTTMWITWKMIQSINGKATRQHQLHNLWGTVQNKNLEPLIKK